MIVFGVAAPGSLSRKTLDLSLSLLSLLVITFSLLALWQEIVLGSYSVPGTSLSSENKDVKRTISPKSSQASGGPRTHRSTSVLHEKCR